MWMYNWKAETNRSPSSGNVMVASRCNCWLETWPLVSWDLGILLMDSVPHRTVTMDACAVLWNIKAVVKEEQGDVTKVLIVHKPEEVAAMMDCGFEK